MALRHVETGEKDNILDFIPQGVTLLPNTSGTRSADEAVRIARLSREVGCGNFIKIKIMRDSKYLLPDTSETIKATDILANEGFVVLLYRYPDLYTARDLISAGAAAVMANTALATAGSLPLMAGAFQKAIKAGRAVSGRNGAKSPDAHTLSLRHQYFRHYAYLFC